MYVFVFIMGICYNNYCGSIQFECIYMHLNQQILKKDY